MGGLPRPLVLVLALGFWLAAGPSPGRGATVPSREFEAPFERVWTVTENILRSAGWKIDQSDRPVGWLLTDARPVESKESAASGKGLRHRLRISLKRLSDTRTLVSIERDLYTEERLLWLVERTPVAATGQAVETGILDAIGQGL
jgi:hypothetical protein